MNAFTRGIEQHYGHDRTAADEASERVAKLLGTEPIKGNLLKGLEDTAAHLAAARRGAPTTAALRKAADASSPNRIFNTGPASGQLAWTQEGGYRDLQDDLQSQLRAITDTDGDDSPSNTYGWVDDVSLDCSRCLICWNEPGQDSTSYVAAITTDPTGGGVEPTLAPKSEWVEVTQQYVTKSIMVKAGACPGCGGFMLPDKNAAGDPVNKCQSCGKMTPKPAPVEKATTTGEDEADQPDVTAAPDGVFLVAKAFGGKKAAPFVSGGGRDPDSSKTADGKVKKAPPK